MEDEDADDQRDEWLKHRSLYDVDVGGFDRRSTGETRAPQRDFRSGVRAMDGLLIKFLVTRLVRIRRGRVGAVTEGE